MRVSPSPTHTSIVSSRCMPLARMTSSLLGEEQHLVFRLLQDTQASKEESKYKKEGMLSDVLSSLLTSR